MSAFVPPTPERMDDPLRPVRYRILRDHAYEPSNVEARFLLDRIRDLERERDVLKHALAEANSQARPKRG